MKFLLLALNVAGYVAAALILENGVCSMCSDLAPRMLELLRLWARLDPERQGDPYRLTAETYRLLTELRADEP